jgi:hypothetical protein
VAALGCRAVGETATFVWPVLYVRLMEPDPGLLKLLRPQVMAIQAVNYLLNVRLDELRSLIDQANTAGDVEGAERFTRELDGVDAFRRELQSHVA